MHTENELSFEGSTPLLQDTEQEISLGIRETDIITKVSDTFASDDKFKVISLVKNGETFKIISSHMPTNAFISQQGYFVEGYLDDYISYLDYLYLSGVNEAKELSILIRDFEILIGAIVCYYDVDIKTNSLKMIRVANKSNGKMIFYRADDMRSSFNVSLLRKLREDMNKKFEGAKNQPGIIEIAKMLKNNPRPTLKLSSYN